MERRVEYEEAFPSLYNSYSITHHNSADYLRLYGNGCREGGVGNREALQIQMFTLSPAAGYRSLWLYLSRVAERNECHAPTRGRYSESVNAEDDALLKGLPQGNKSDMTAYD